MGQTGKDNWRKPKEKRVEKKKEWKEKKYSRMLEGRMRKRKRFGKRREREKEQKLWEVIKEERKECNRNY